MALPDLPIVYPLFAHYDCTHNQLTAIHNRVCGEVPEPHPQAIARLHSFARRLGRTLGRTKPLTPTEFVNRYSGGKRMRYQDAADQLARYGITAKDADVKMFIKCEKIKFSEAKNNPDPRAIQFRNPVFAVAFGCHLKPIEERIYALRGNRRNGLPPYRLIGKGLNQGQRAELLKTKLTRFVRPVVMSLDMSRFDQHVSEGLLRAEHLVYVQVDNSPAFSRLCDMQIVNRVTTSKGLRYRTRGKRMSGDMNTALGNCIIAVMMIALYFQDKDMVWDVLDDGDDMLLVVEEEYLPLMESELPAHFLSLGMVVKIEGLATTLPGVEWCQSKPVELSTGWKFIRQPSKVMSGALAGPKWMSMKTHDSRRKLCYTIGLCELILNHGVPVLQEYALALMRNAGTVAQVRLEQAEQLAYRVRAEIGKSRLTKIPKWSAAPITQSARATFAEAFGIDEHTQLLYEDVLRAWRFTLEDPVEHPTPIDVQRWEWVGQQVECRG